jgi:hypothetical protein
VLLDFIHRLVLKKKKNKKKIKKIEIKIKIKNYRQKIKTRTDQNTNVHKQITQGPITNHRANLPGHTHTYKHLRPERHRWQQVTQPLTKHNT